MDNFGGYPPNFCKQLEWINRITDPITDIIPPAIQQQQELIGKLFPPGIRNLLSEIENREVQLKESIVTLADLGWFVGLSLPLTVQRKVLEEISANPTHIDEILYEYYESKFELLEQELVNQQPQRTKILRDIFSGHRAKLYSLTVPTAFAQVDGICASSKFQGYLFMRHRGSKLSQFGQNILDTDLCDYQKLLLSPFMSPLSIAFNVKERLSGETVQLNRHTVIHGESSNYGNRVNSMKAIILLCYVSKVLTRA